MNKMFVILCCLPLMTASLFAGSQYDSPKVYFAPAANPNLATESYKDKEPVVATITRQKRGMVYTARVGEPIVETARRKTWSAITLKTVVPVEITDKNGTVFSFVISGTLVQKAESAKGKFFQAEQTISVKGTTNYLKGGLFIENDTGLQTAFWFPPYDLPAVMVPMQPVAYSKDIHSEEEDADFRIELLYMGKTKDTIRLAYREFIEDKIRPAFSQEVSYDYTGPTEVSYKNFELEVIEATGSKIVYRVVNP
jgi:hypothetical protein